MTTNITAYFTTGGLPATGLVPGLTVRNVETGAVVVTGTLGEVGDGWYRYQFVNYTGSVDYAITVNGSSSLLDSQYAYAGNENFVSDVWGALKTDHTGTNTMGHVMTQVSSSISFLQGIEGGRWHIVGTQMIFYGPDNSTEIARFNLFDAGGTPSSTSPFERRRV